MPHRLTCADINLANYSHNLSKMRELIPKDTKVMAVVKANAYGHGLERIAQSAIDTGVEYLGVACLGELLKVRRAGISAPVLLLNYLDPDSIAEAIEYNASITVMDEAIIPVIDIAAKSRSKIVKVHIKVDTGMHRAGCEPDKLTRIARKVKDSEHLVLEGVFTHFAESEALNGEFTQQQLSVFNKSIDMLRNLGLKPPLLHCANSAAIINHPEAHFTMVRPGIITYGLNPFPKKHPMYQVVINDFKPVLSLKTQVIFVRTIDIGETVGYNRRWKAQRTSKLALLPVGYGDGYRSKPHSAPTVLINGQRAPIIGNIAMDQTVIDITDIRGDVMIGDEVVLLGNQGSLSICADDLAEAYKTINYEVITALSERVDRRYIA